MDVSQLRDDARACHAAALAAVDPTRLVAAALARDATGAWILADAPASHRGPVLVVGAGKAAIAMAAGVGDDARGLVVAPHDARGRAPAGVRVLRGAHPVPDADGLAATATLRAAVAAAGPEVLVVVLLSGGASALLVAPADGVRLADAQAVTRALLAAGADIGELNVVRRHLSAVKGGGLLRDAAHARAVWTLALSDVVGDDLATIASGPTVADPSTFADALAVLERRLPADAVPASVRARLEAGRAGRVTETVKPGDPVLGRATARVIGSNRTAVAAAATAAAARGYDVVVRAAPLAGDAATAGRALVREFDGVPATRPVALVAGGETTVQVVPGGRGGRSQQLALAAALALDGRAGVVLLAAGTDGVDGPTDAAGAVVDGTSATRMRGCGVDPAAALAATDAHPALDAAGDLLRTGPTGTNVADLVVALRSACYP